MMMIHDDSDRLPPSPPTLSFFFFPPNPIDPFIANPHSINQPSAISHHGIHRPQHHPHPHSSRLHPGQLHIPFISSVPYTPFDFRRLPFLPSVATILYSCPTGNPIKSIPSRHGRHLILFLLSLNSECRHHEQKNGRRPQRSRQEHRIWSVHPLAIVLSRVSLFPFSQIQNTA